MKSLKIQVSCWNSSSESAISNIQYIYLSIYNDYVITNKMTKVIIDGK